MLDRKTDIGIFNQCNIHLNGLYASNSHTKPAAYPETTNKLARGRKENYKVDITLCNKVCTIAVFETLNEA